MKEVEERIEYPKLVVRLLVPSTIVTPKQRYFEKVAAANVEHRSNLRELFEMGFTNFEVNIAMVAKYKDCGVVGYYLSERGASYTNLNCDLITESDEDDYEVKAYKR